MDDYAWSAQEKKRYALFLVVAVPAIVALVFVLNLGARWLEMKVMIWLGMWP